MKRYGIAVSGIFLSALLLGMFSGCSSLSNDRRQAGWLTPPSKRIATPAREARDDAEVLRGQTEDKRRDAQRYLDQQYATYPDGASIPNNIPAPVTSSGTVPAPVPVVPVATVPVAPVASAWDSAPPALPAGWDQIMPDQVMPPPQHLSSWEGKSSAIDALPWESGHSVSIEDRAKEEELAAQKARLVDLAREQEKNATASHLRAIEPWAGPFGKREATTGPDEREIILAGYRQEPVFKIEENIELYDWEKEEEKFDWEQLDPVTFFHKIRDWAGYGPDEKKATALMEQGREILLQNPDLKDRKKSVDAAKLFLQATKRWPNSAIAEESLYLAGECYFFADMYPKALECYKQLISEYHHSKHLDTSVRRLFAIGRYWEKQSLVHKAPVNFSDKSRPTTDDFGNAKRAYEAIFTNDPNGPISDDAVMALAMAYLARGEQPGDAAFENAVFYFSYLRENYPQSRHAVKAREMELHAQLNTYYGPGYNKDALVKAGKLADQTLRQYDGDLSPKEKAEIREIQETMRLKEAESDFEMARYYDKKAEYGAARLHYRKLVEKHPHTTFAEQARARLEAIKDKPDTPGHFDWAKNLIDSTKRAKKTEER